MEQKVIYNSQVLTLTRFWATGELCLWITAPQQIGMPKMEFVGGHPDEYCIFLKNLTETELVQITFLDGAPLDVKENEATSKEMNTMKEPIRNPIPKPPKYIDVDYMTLPDIDTNPLFYDEDAQEILAYWTDGKKVYWQFS